MTVTVSTKLLRATEITRLVNILAKRHPDVLIAIHGIDLRLVLETDLITNIDVFECTTMGEARN